MSEERPTGATIELAEAGGVRIRRAIISVFDKRGVIELAQGLRELGVEIISTGGTASVLAQAAIDLRAVSDFTGFPEILDGRVKTLHPRLYGGLLTKRDEPEQLQEANAQGMEPVDLVCVNLYPFEQTVARAGVSAEEAIENIDIGGPTMIRAAAKNHRFAVVLVDPDDYGDVLAELRYCGGRLPLATRERLAARAFAYTARYDASIYRWFAPRSYAGFAPRWAAAYEKVADLRYGENPHQQAAFFAEVGAPQHLLQDVEQLNGKELSFNNLLDLSAARSLVEEFAEAPGRDDPAVAAIIKHNTPCGCALGSDGADAYARALACDPQSAFGGIVALNRTVDGGLAATLAEHFLEVIFAPGFEPEALQLLGQKKNLRLLALPGWPRAGGEVDGAVVEKRVLGGLLAQTADHVSERREQMRVVTKCEPSEEQWADLLFAWSVCAHVRSNAIVLAAREATIGVGAGQMSRVDAVRIAAEKARSAQPKLLAGCSLASDAYFPFADNVELAAEAGVQAIIQPGGSVRDQEVIEAADAAGIAMVFTDVRHFLH